MSTKNVEIEKEERYGNYKMPSAEVRKAKFDELNKKFGIRQNELIEFDSEGLKRIIVGRPPNLQNESEIFDAMQDYLISVIDRRAPVTVSGIAVWLGLTRRQLLEFREQDRFKTSLNRLINWAEQHYEERLLNPSGSPIGAIFALKNNFGWTDKQEIELSGQVSIGNAIGIMENRDDISSLEGEIVEEQDTSSILEGA